MTSVISSSRRPRGASARPAACNGRSRSGREASCARPRAASSVDRDAGATRCAVSAVSGRAQRPDMKVVDRLDPVEPAKLGLDLVDVDARGHAHQRHPDRFLQQADAAPQDDAGDREAHHRIDPVLPGPQDDEAREHHRRRDGRVGRHVLEGGADIEVVRRGRARTARRSARLPTIATPPTQIIACASAGAGWNSRRTASAAIAPTATSRNKALISAARIEAFLKPVGEARRGRTLAITAPAQPTTSPSTSERLCPASAISAIELARSRRPAR